MIVEIKNGKIRGSKEKGMLAFKNIPFAKPPIGDLRFKPPVPVENWEGVLDCTKYGPRPCQNPPPWCEDRDTAVYSEDCLNLNVWTPAIDNKKRPVAFYIFGGGHMEGSNSEIGCDGPNLAHGRDIVVVSPNYRLGALGYLYLGHLLGDEYKASGSLGLLDQVLALKWVRDNISYFGGDPEKVTIIGQSAGGKAVCSLLVTPEAKGLFRGAVAMSGALQCITDIETDMALTRNFLKAMNLSEQDVHELLNSKVEDILMAQEKANEIYFKAESYGPTADGIVLPLDIEKHIKEGNVPQVPVIMGHTKQELWPFPDAEHHESLSDIQARMTWKFGDNGDYVMRRYEEYRRKADFVEAYGRIMTDYTYIQGCLRTAKYFVDAGLPVWMYRWDYEGGLIANHSSDIEALFGRTNPQKRNWNKEVSDKIDRAFQDVILNFIIDGVPSSSYLPDWKVCKPGNGFQMIFDEEFKLNEIDLDEYDKEFPLQVMRLKYK
ncbi:MAG: carboxylesterase family protein [Clostridiales bacterium]|mgnify:CR=1 FL=1|nr:carboxylesterase family protein [Clostridiales bacterium]